MTPDNFIKKYWPIAKKIQAKTKIPALAIMAQAALESGWGKYAIGNNLFGIKYRTGDWNYQKVLTTEYSSSPNKFKGQKIKSIKYVESLNKYRYKIWQYFAEYKTPHDGFLAHAKLLLSNRYKDALKWTYSPLRYLIAVWRSGYATDPNYPKKMAQMIHSVKKRLPRNEIEMERIKSIPTPKIN